MSVSPGASIASAEDRRENDRKQMMKKERTAERRETPALKKGKGPIRIRAFSRNVAIKWRMPVGSRTNLG